MPAGGGAVALPEALLKQWSGNNSKHAMLLYTADIKRVRGYAQKKYQDLDIIPEGDNKLVIIII